MGSFRYFGDIFGDQLPFTVGPIWTAHGLVHVFDEGTLDIVFRELDTVADFVTYLSKRSELLSPGKPIIFADGEEQLLATYLKNTRDDEHYFDLGMEPNNAPFDAVYLCEGHWEGLKDHPQYLAKKSADIVSYNWDELVSKFIEIGDPTLVEMSSWEPERDVEPAIREMAGETRFARRILADGLVKFVESLEPGKAKARVMLSPSTNNRVYAVLAEPFVPEKYSSYEEYRRKRIAKVAAYAIVSRTKFPTARVAIGIAFDGPTYDMKGGSEDLFCHSVPEVTQDILEDATRIQHKLGILLPENVTSARFHHQEYPDTPSKISRQQRRAIERAAKKNKAVR